MTTLDQGALVAGMAEIRYGHRSVPNVAVLDAPDDTDLMRYAVLHDGIHRRMFCFKEGSTDTLYQFGWDGRAFRFGHESMPEVTLTNLPADADTSSFAMVHSGDGYHAFLPRLGDPTTLYQFTWIPGTTKYDWAYDGAPGTLPIAEYPRDSDWGRWQMFHDGVRNHVAVFHHDLPGRVAIGSWCERREQFVYGRDCIAEIDIVDYPPTSRVDLPAMYHDGKNLRCVFLAP